MDKVLIFTNENSWNNITKKIRDKVNWDTYPNNNSPIMQCVVNNDGKVDLYSKPDFNEAGIYLIYDEINMAQLSQLLDKCKNDSLYILLHSYKEGRRRPEDFTPWERHCYIERGLHDNDDSFKYKPTFKIITDSEGNKTDRIIKNIFAPLEEAAMELLYICTVPKKKIEETDAYRTLIQNEKYRNLLEKFKIKYDSCNNFDEYKDEWEKLRKDIVPFPEN